MTHKSRDINILVFSITCIATILILANGAYQLISKQAELKEVTDEKDNLEKDLTAKDSLFDSLTQEAKDLSQENFNLAQTTKITQEKVEVLEQKNNNLKESKKKLSDSVKEKDKEIVGLRQLSQQQKTVKQDSIAKPAQQKQKQSSGREINAKYSYYTAQCEGCTGITYTGVDVRNTIHHNGMRVIATDPTVIPMYSIVEVSYPGATFKAIALDIGSAIKGNRIDILVGSRKEAYRLGRKEGKVRILREGKGD